MLDIDRVGRDIENLYSELELDTWENRTGRKDETNEAAIREKYSHLASKPLFEQIAIARETATGELAKRLRYIAEMIGTTFVTFEVKELSDQANAKKSKGTVEIDGVPTPFNELLPKIYNEADRSKRAKLYNSRNNFIGRDLNPILMQRMHGLHSAAVSLGYPSYTQMYQDLMGVDLEELYKQFRLLIEKTDDIYFTEMNARMEKIAGVELEKAEKHDLYLTLRVKELDKYFPKEKLVETFRKTFLGMGIDLEGLPNVNLDLEERPKKVPRAFTALVRVPSDIRLVIKPQGGVNDYRTFGHEGGHTLHLAHTDSLLPPEFKILGDISVTESYAGLLEGLTRDPEWLQEMLGIKEVKPIMDAQKFLRFYMTRRYGAKLGYEIELHQQNRLKDLLNMPESYNEALERALVFKHPRTNFLIDVDDAFYGIYYLKSFILEAQLQNYLERNFGGRWWENPESGEFLKSLWGLGQKYDANEMAQRLGYSGLDIQPVISDYQSYFS